ncbi:phage minor tail protein L [Xenorhabdus hominickii]|uniref:Putative tail component of prophage n=1 Tax=Xenorhabdus hominickii TaxID=351679 RepID=A0A2G0Q6M7_XENHO|nr:phage minor tail protein L [Xenorhabdus hominickii]PHM54878.1 putative tail component of prophage [Xenorhabdus hominickii]
MTINATLQRLEPGSKILLFSVDGSVFGGPELYFHNHTIPYAETELENLDNLPMKSIWWQGGLTDTQCCQFGGLYQCPVSGLSKHGSGACHYPHDLCALSGCRSFPEGNPEADPTQEKIDVFYIDSKTSEDNTTIHFALSSPADLQGIQIPTRQIHSLCTCCIRGLYRKSPCGYTGSQYFDIDGNPTDDPSKDDCSGLLSTGCELRFGKGNRSPFGGFPGFVLLKR